MDTSASGCSYSLDEPCTYRIRVLGQIRPTWYDRFEGMSIDTRPGPQDRPVTTLHGTLPDQAALMGVINSLYDLRLPVLSVERLDLQLN